MKSLVLLLSLAACAADPGSSSAPLEAERSCVVFAGQSHAVGGAKLRDLAAADRAIYGAPRAEVTLVQRLAGGKKLPLAWQDFAAAPLAPRNGKLFGAELSFSRALDRPHDIVKFAVSGSELERNWLPSTTYPQAEDNLYRQLVAFIGEQEIALGEPCDTVVWMQGDADANSLGRAKRYGKNLVTFVTQLREDLGHEVLFVYGRLHADASAPHGATLRGQQEWFQAALPDVRMVDADDLPLLPDATHYTPAAFLELGERYADAAEGP